MSWIELVAQRHPPRPPAGMQPPENAKDWFRITNSAEDPDATDVLIYDSIGGWFGLYADEFVDSLKQITSRKINLRLNSPGGSVFEGITVANALRAHPASVTVYVDGLAASIASVIAMAGERLVMMPQSQLMVHNASAGCYGDATEMTKMADLLDKQSLNIAQAYAEYSGRSLAEWQDYMAAETWFTAEEALAVGLADEVMPMRAKQEAPANEPEPVEARMQRTWDLSMYQYAGREKAPAPQLPFANGGILPGQAITSAMLGGIDLSGDIAGAAQPIEPRDIPGATPGTITIDFSQMTDAGPNASFDLPTFMDSIRALVREEIANAAPPFLPKKGEGDEEDEDGDEEEDEEPQPDDSLAAAPSGALPEETPPDDGDSVTATHDQADEHNPFVGLLHAPTSPRRADDVFAQLKEGW